MKTIITIGMILLLLVPAGMKTALVAYYQLNKAYISANFCENKTRPKMECNGKCYLAKQLKKQEQSEKNIPSLIKGMEEVVLFYSELNFDFTLSAFNEKTSAVPAYIVSDYKSPLENIFQPPQ